MKLNINDKDNYEFTESCAQEYYRLMKIAFVNPVFGDVTNIDRLRTFWDLNEAASPFIHIWTGLSPALLTLAALCPKGSELILLDERFEVIDYTEMYDIVAITAMTPQALRAYYIADEFRRRGKVVVLGGLHVTVLPEEAEAHADAVVVGEGDILWKEVLTDFIAGNLKTRYIQKPGIDLKKVPIPRFDLCNPSRYGFVNIQTTRGCPHDCSFCSASLVFGKTYRTKTVEQVLQEVTAAKLVFEDTPIFFSDDNFLVNRSHAKKLLHRLREKKIRWSSQADISICEDTALLDLMRESGCASIFIGFETLSDANMIKIDGTGFKVRRLDSYPRMIEQIQSHGIAITGSFIVGLDHDDVRVFDRIIRFVQSTGLFRGIYTILAPAPGTRIRAELESENRLLPHTWDAITGYNVTYSPKKMSVEDLKDGLTYIYEETFNPTAVLKRVGAFTLQQVKRRRIQRRDT